MLKLGHISYPFFAILKVALPLRSVNATTRDCIRPMACFACEKLYPLSRVFELSF